MLADTHIHFDSLMQAGDTIGAIMERATQAGVNRMIAIGGSPAANQTAVAAARAYPDIIRAAVGYNRDQATDDRRQTTDQALPKGYALARASPEKMDTEEDDRGRMPDAGRRTRQRGRQTPDAGCRMDAEEDDGKQKMDELETLLRAPEVVAVGEIGLDFHHGRETALAQIELFQRMLLLARDPDSQRGRDLPVCVHTRAAEAETLAALREHTAAWRGAPERIGVMHCFTGGEVFARDLLTLGFHISFSGILTFKNAGGLLAVAALVPEDRLLIETDSPYLAPEPFRGQPNEPSHVRRVAEVLAEIRHTSWETIAELTARNAERLFGRSE